MTRTYKADDITFLKGIAILGIVLVHSSICIENINVYIDQITRIGQFGCQLFFLISGYLMMHSWNRIESEQPFINKLKNFYKKRIVAILPVYVSVVVFYQILSLSFEYSITTTFFYEIRHDISSIILNLVLLHGIDINNYNNIVPGGWFIGTISLYYLLFPFLKCLYDRIENKPYLIIILPSIAVLISFTIQYCIFLYEGSWINSRRGGFIYYSILNQLPCMLLGMNIATPSVESYMEKKRLLYKILMSMLFGSFGLFLFFVLRRELYVYIFFPYIISLFFFYLFHIVVHISEKTDYFKGRFYTVIVKWGKLSFAVYFSNFIAGMLIPWIVVSYLSTLNKSFSPTILYVCLLPFIYILSYVIAIPIQRYIDLLKKQLTSKY